MTVLFQSDFESSSGTIAHTTGMPGWASDAANWLVFDASVVSLTAVNGARIFGSSDNFERLYYSASGTLTDQAIRHAAKWQSHAAPHVIGHLLRRETSTKYYYTIVETDGSALRVRIALYDGGSTDLATSSYGLTCSVGDVIHHETKMVGTTIESRIWKNSESRPSTATASATNSTISSGYPGAVKVGANSYYAVGDQLVVTDGAGGEDYFYPDGTTISCNLGSASASGYAASILAATTIACSLGTADASGYQATIQVGSGTTISCSLGTATASGYQATVTTSGTGYLITEPLKNNTGTLLASQTGATAYVYNVSTGALVVSKTGQTTDVSGVMTISDALITPATQYRVVVVLSGGAEGLAKYTAT